MKPAAAVDKAFKRTEAIFAQFTFGEAYAQVVCSGIFRVRAHR